MKISFSLVTSGESDVYTWAFPLMKREVWWMAKLVNCLCARELTRITEVSHLLYVLPQKWATVWPFCFSLLNHLRYLTWTTMTGSLNQWLLFYYKELIKMRKNRDLKKQTNRKNLIAFRKHWQYLHNSTANFSSYSVKRSNLTISWIWRRLNSYIINKTDLRHQKS